MITSSHHRTSGFLTGLVVLACVALLNGPVWADNQQQLPRLGITVSQTSGQQGLKIDDVQQDGPAQKAGVASNDQLLEIDGRQIDSFSDVQQVLQQAQPNAKVSFKFSRNGGQKTADVTLGSQTGGQQQAKTQQQQFLPQLGLAVSQTSGQKGLAIDNVRQGSPAQQAGLTSGDRLLAINGQQINSFSDAQQILQQTQPNTQVNLSFSQNGEQKTAQATLPTQAMAQQGQQGQACPERAWLGVMLSEIGMGQIPGVLVAGVFPNGPAEQAGVVAGDRIIAIDNHPLSTRDQLVGYLQEKKPGDQIDLLVFRQGNWETIQATLANQSEFVTEGMGGGQSPPSPETEANRHY